MDGNFTIEAWFRSRSTAETIPDGDRHIISATGQGFPNATYYGLTLNDGIPSAYYISNQAIRTSVFSNARITDEGWHHFAATLDTEDDVFSLYLDGNLVASRTAVTTPNTGTNRLLIGSSGFNDRLDDEGFLGDIDEVKIWDFAKSKEQIRDGVPRRPLINEEGLQLYFDMEDNLSQGFIRDKSTLTVTTGQVLNLDRVQRSIRRLGLQEAILLAEQPVTTATLDSVFTARNTSLIITQDMTPPEVLVRDSVTISLGAGGIVTLDAAQLIISANDFCGEITHILDRNTFDCTVNDTPQTVILTSTDLSGNIDLDTTVVTLESPVSYFNCGDPIFVFLEENGQASIREAVDSLEQITFSQIAVSRDTFDCTDLGFFDLEAVVTDPFSNVINTVISLFIIDTQDPVAQCVEPFSISLDRNGVATLDVSMIDNGSFDNCSFISSLSQTQFDSTNLGVNEIMLILEDDIGRRDTCSTEVTITGFLPPVATCQPTDTVFLDQNGNVAITTVDIYDGDVNNPDISELQLDRTSFDCSMTGEQSVTLTLTDFEGTITTCTTDLIVLDTIAPFANCVDPLIVELDSTGSVMLTAGEINNGSSDACSFVVSLSRSEFQLEDLGENLVELIISDPSGNTSTCSTIVTVRDQIAPQVEEASFSIIENSANGTVIGILSAVDQLGTNLQDWIISSGNSEGILALNSLSGEISIADNALLDAETINTISFGATVTDGNNTSQEQSFIVEVIDENDVIPVIIPNQEFIISASTVNGTPFGIPFAEDGDVSVTTFVDWAIVSGNDGGTFSIDPITGQIQVVDNALLEGVDSFMIGLTVSDGVNVSALETITIQLVTDNNPPIVVADQFFNMVENIENDVVVGVIQVTDQENNIIRDWQIVSGNDIGIFGISRDGLLTVIDNSTIDFESGKISYELGIVASDGIDQSEIENVLVNVVDVNDVFPVIDFGQEFTIRENSPNGFIIGALSASDGDITPTEFTDWLITNQTNDSLFVIDTATGELIVNSSELLDFINNPIIDLIVTVSDGVNTSEMTSVQIQVIEPGNLPPTIPSGQLFEIPENISNGDLVGTILATDLESDPLTWEIVSGNEAAIFHLNGNTGELTVNDNSLIDHEQEISYELMITVSDQELTSLESSIVVNVTDINDVAPNIEPGQQFAVFENSPNETLVGRVEAADGDSTPGVFVNWEIISGNEMGVFSIDPVAGTIHVANSENLNFELVDSYELEVRVSDAINLSDPETVVISVLNINDPPTISDIADLTVNSNEQAGPISFRVFDEDNSSDNLGVEFILDTEFPIASENVMINGTVEDKTITLTPTAEAQGITQVTLIVSDGILSDTTRFTVSVIQVSENSPPVGITLSSSSFAEEVPVNHEVGVLETIDADAFDNHTYELSEGAGDVDNDLFQIVGDRLLTNSLFDFEDQPTRTIRVRSTDSFGASIEMPFLLDLIPNPNLPLLVTNAFTPNGDGVNDTWYIDNISFHPDARIIVINDRGNVVFESIGYDTPWNGQFNGNILSFGVYYYSISLSNGVSLSGPLTIIR
ncbi:MAG: cadherin domain-containing protein [Bacteroidota bacterium]